MSTRTVHRGIAAFFASLLLAPLLIAFAPSAGAEEDRFCRNNCCRASGQNNEVNCSWQDDDDSDKDGDKKEIYVLKIVLLSNNNTTVSENTISKVISLGDVFAGVFIGNVSLGGNNNTILSNITGDVADVLLRNLISWQKVCAERDGQSSCRSS